MEKNVIVILFHIDFVFIDNKLKDNFVFDHLITFSEFWIVINIEN